MRQRGMRTALTPGEIVRAKRLRDEHHLEWTDVARRMKRSYELIRRALDTDYAAHRNQQVVLRRSRGRTSPEVRWNAIPQSVLDDRERRQEAPRSLSAMLFGDPPQGYSALDQKSND